MKIKLDPSDLREEYQKGTGNDLDQACSTRDVTFDHLNDTAQTVVEIAGRAVFYSWDRMTYNAVYPPTS